MTTAGPTESKFLDFPEDLYPIKTFALMRATGVIVWEEEILSPGAVFVPPLAKTYGLEALLVGTIFTDGSGHLFDPSNDVTWGFGW